MNLVSHARKELELLGEDPDVIDWMISVIKEFSKFGHSGSSGEMLAEVLYDLLHYKNLTPLTTNKVEWVDRSEISGIPIWQSARNPQAFSDDGGLSYYLINDGKDPHEVFDCIEYSGD